MSLQKNGTAIYAVLEWFNMQRNTDFSYQQPHSKHTGRNIYKWQQIKKQQVNGQKMFCWNEKLTGKKVSTMQEKLDCFII